MRKSWLDNESMQDSRYEQESQQAPIPTVRQYAEAPQRKRSLMSRLYDWVMEAEPLQALRGGIFMYDTQTQEGQPMEYRQLADSNDAMQMQSELIRKALQDWKTATAYFENVSDPALVDYAAYDMEAARRKYIYLLSAAKKMHRS